MKTHKTRSGRIMVELDGTSNFYNGALIQGAIIARFSIPADVDINFVLSRLPKVPNAGPDYIDSIREVIPGIRVYRWSMVQ